jgi:hypothetical protein
MAHWVRLCGFANGAPMAHRRTTTSTAPSRRGIARMMALPTRIELPNRRPHLVETFEWNGQAWKMGLGFDDAGAVREVFLEGPKAGTDLQALAVDARIVLSRLLQRGDTAAEIAKSLNGLGLTGDAAPTLIHAAVAHAARAERDVAVEP